MLVTSRVPCDDSERAAKEPVVQQNPDTPYYAH